MEQTTQYERKVKQIKNRPVLSIFQDDGGSVSTATLKSTREEVQLNYRIFKQLCQKGEKEWTNYI